MTGSVLLVNRFYGSPQIPTGRMTRDVAEELVARGAEVTVLFGGGSYEGIEHRAWRPEGGIRIATPPIPRWVGRARLASWLTFWLWFPLWLLLAGRRFDHVVLLTDPPFLPFWFGVVPRAPRLRSVTWWTMDLYPEALVAAGLVRGGGLLERGLRWLNEVGLRAVDRIVCLSPRQKRALEEYVCFSERHRTVTIPPWDLRPFRRIASHENRLAEEMGWTGRQVVLYAGNLGEAHDVSDLIAAARFLHAAGDTRWLFLFAVRGSKKADLVARTAGLPNVEVRDYFPPERTAELLSIAAVHVVTIQPDWLAVLVPSKVFGAIATGRPVLFMGAPDGFVAGASGRLVTTMRLGTPPHAVADILEALAFEPTRNADALAAEQRRHLDDLVTFVVGEK